MDVKLYMKLRKLKEGPIKSYESIRRFRTYGFRNRMNLNLEFENPSLKLSNLNYEKKLKKKDRKSFEKNNEKYKSPKDEFAATRFQIKRVNDISRRKEYKQSDLSVGNQNSRSEKNRSKNKEQKNNQEEFLNTLRDKINKNFEKESLSHKYISSNFDFDQKLKLKEIQHENELLRNDLIGIRKINKSLIKNNKIIKIENLDIVNEKYNLEKYNKKIQDQYLNKIKKLETVIIEIQDAIKIDIKKNFKIQQNYEHEIEKLYKDLKSSSNIFDLLNKNLNKLLQKNLKHKEIIKSDTKIDQNLLIENNLEIEFSLKYLLNILNGDLNK